MSIRLRLTLAMALVLAITLGLLGVTVVRNTQATLIGQVDQQIATNTAKENQPDSSRKDAHDGYDDAKELAAACLQSPPQPGPHDYTLFGRYVYTTGGQQVFAINPGYGDDPKSPPKGLPLSGHDLKAALGRFTTMPAADGSLRYRVYAEIDACGHVSYTAASLANVDNVVRDLIYRLMLWGGIALLAAIIVSWLLIARGLRPVDRMIATAAAIGKGDLARRVPDSNPRTELGRLGHALNEMLGQIERAVQARAASEARLRRFVADAAHELRTPLTSLRGYAELYRQGALRDDTAVANAMRRIESEGERMARLVDDLLLLARLDQQRGLEREPVDAIAIVRDAAQDFAVTAPDRPLTLDLDGVAMVRGDRHRLRQVIDNLLANVRTHTPPGSAVEITARRVNGQVEIAVRDHGPGIPADGLERVFERFWRADPARARSRGGTGLGLAIVASLVEAHGGTIDVQSEVGEGAVFTVRLPLLVAAPAPVLTTPAPVSGVQPADGHAHRHGF